MQDEKYQQKSQSISSAEPNYFVHFAMRHPVDIQHVDDLDKMVHKYESVFLKQ